ncbi:hypothetical protein [Salinivibrio kushneri]|uniref:hypothetical protein n=1 Tax=Salinivibrio kushneri TaxID=1908198 RepID=UPI00098883D7|nr:hypothetical protein [Salinivibrio kushneri]OOE52198.1 hypothetical protein BZG12_11120 [Salinivibrio kushneri]
MTIFFLFVGCILPTLFIFSCVKKNTKKDKYCKWVDPVAGLALILIASVTCEFLLEQVKIIRHFERLPYKSFQSSISLESLLIIVVPLVVGGIGVNLISGWLKER